MSGERPIGADSGLVAALSFPLTTNRRALGAAVVAVVTYVALVLSSFPEYSAQMLAAGFGYLDEAVLALTANTYATIGPFGLSLVVMYAVLTAVALTNVATQLRLQDVSGVRDLLGVVPGLLASGCASCGAGVLGLLGFAGALAAMPFDGNLLRLGGIVLLLFFLARSGDPRACRVS
ncbi:hypothetical protein [Halococcus qingdaonensis]|uniref:hypothetical protein n=1 Tax=Halococcus qingdaonensis TaxID=224402 RepID=UPI002116DE56|nr:hypothetical protein [Halococcus qingdaonensis]